MSNRCFMELTKEDYFVIDEKSERPERDVRCPHCGGQLIVEYFGNSCITRCENGCISETSRGL